MTIGNREDGRIKFVGGLVGAGSRLDARELCRRLDEQPVVLVIGRNMANRLEAQTTALTAVNLLARLFRRLVIVGPEVDVDARLPFASGRLGPALAAFAGRVHRDVRAEVVDAAPTGALVLHVADPDAAAAPGHAFCAGAGWLARVGQRPFDMAPTEGGNPVGPLMAAVLGVAELFKLAFADVLPNMVRAEDIAFSALTLEVGDLDPGPRLDAPHLLDTILVGSGSIGSAFLWGLTHVRNSTGKLVVVDHDRLADHNPDRAILVLDSLAEQKPWKAEWARDTVRPWLERLDVRAYRGTIREYVDTLGANYTLPLVISAVDRIDSRRDIQDALPRRILNASTGATSVEITGHNGLGDGPCLYCVYLPDLLANAPITVALTRTGFPPKLLAEMLVPDSKRVLNADNIRGIERRNSVPEGTFAHYVGRQLQELLIDRLWYGQVSVPLENGQALVTTAFVSALAGFLLLAQALIEADPTLRRNRLLGHYEQDLLGIPNAFVNPGQRDPTGRCLCHDPFRRRLYREKYGNSMRID